MTSESVQATIEDAVRIAWNFLHGSGEIIDGYEATSFLVAAIGKLALAGERRKLMLANRAIDAYRRSRTQAA
ncbi:MULTISPECIES: hypothetical protein [unclassified Bradyrhizobium]